MAIQIVVAIEMKVIVAIAQDQVMIPAATVVAATETAILADQAALAAAPTVIATMVA